MITLGIGIVVCTTHLWSIYIVDCGMCYEKVHTNYFQRVVADVNDAIFHEVLIPLLLRARRVKLVLTVRKVNNELFEPLIYA